MNDESLKEIKDYIKTLGVTNREMSRISGIAHTRINEYLNGKHRINDVKFAVWLEVFSKGKFTAKWILETDFKDEVLTKISDTKIAVSDKLNKIKADFVEKIKSIENNINL